MIILTELGSIVFGKMLVVGVTHSGIPVKYLDIETGKIILTSYGASKKGNIIEFSEEEILDMAENSKIEKYSIYKQIFQEFVDKLLETIKDSNPQEYINLTIVKYGFYDTLTVSTEEEIYDLTLPIQHIKIKI